MATTILTVIGARPQFIKAAAVSREFRRRKDIREIIVHTGQHFDDNMSQIFFDELDIPPPDYNLKIHSNSHGAMTGQMLERVEDVLLREKPGCVLVYGDTNSTLAGALAATKLHIPVAHVEAGLRSYNRRMPEEINRILTDHSSEFLFCPTQTAIDNLAQEGVRDGVYWTGDVMYDAALHARARAEERSQVLTDNGLTSGTFALATVHRAENTENADALKRVIEYLEEQTDQHAIVLPLHPRTRAAAHRYGLDFGNIILLPPVGFIDMAALLAHCTQVFTDSGGVQKEAYFHGKLCVTLRNETEWIETVSCGWNRLWAFDKYKFRQPITDYGDGSASRKIVDLLINNLHISNENTTSSENPND